MQDQRRDASVKVDMRLRRPLFPAAKRGVLFVGLLIALSNSLRGNAGEPIAIRVSPDTPRLTTTGVPFLHEEVDEALSPEDGLDLRPEISFHWSKAGPTVAPFRLKIEIDRKKFSKGVLTVWNWHNHPIGQWEIEPDAPTPVSVVVDGLGVYQFTLDGYEGGSCRKRLVRSVSVTKDLRLARDSWNMEEFFLGVCAFPGRYHWSFRGEPTLPPGLSEEKAREIEADLLSRIGFQVVRVDESKEMGDRTPGSQGEYRFQFDRMDAAVEAYTSRGFQLGFQLMNAPDWAIADSYADRNENRWRYPRREDPQRAYVRALVERYGKHARFVQIFNEPDQVEFWAGKPEEFVNQFHFSVEEIHGAVPQMPIINGGYSLVDLERTRYFVEKLKGEITLPAYHSHGDLPALREDFETIRNLHREAGYEKVRFLNTEMGFDGWRLDQERSKGAIVPQKTLFCWANDHAGVLLFGGRMTLGPARVTQDFGFLDHFFCPRYVCGSVAALVSTLQGATFSEVLHDDGDTVIYQFRHAEDLILSGFALSKASSVSVGSDAKRWTSIDAMGNETKVDPDSRFTWKLGAYPRYLVLEAASESKVQLESKE